MRATPDALLSQRPQSPPTVKPHVVRRLNENQIVGLVIAVIPVNMVNVKPFREHPP